MPHKRAGTVLAVLGALFIAALTLRPAGDPPPAHAPFSLINGRLSGADFLLNILLFVPFATGLRLAGVARWRVFASAVAATLTVEALQLHVIAGRDASLGDVLSNSMGAIVGMLLVDHARTIAAPDPLHARRLSITGAAAWLSLVALGAWAMRPAIPRGQYWAEVAPDLYQIELFSGTVSQAAVNGVRLESPSSRLIARPSAPDLLADTVRIAATTVPASPTYDIAPIVAIGTRRERMLVALGQTGRSLAIQLNTNSAKLRMRVPSLVVPNAFPAADGGASDVARTRDTLRIAGSVVDGKRLILDLESEPRAHAELELNPFLLWATVLPGGPFAPSRMDLLTIAWIAILVAPFAYWGGRAWRVSPFTDGRYSLATDSRIVLILAIGLGLGVVPPLFGFAIARPLFWVAAILVGSSAFVVGSRLRDDRTASRS